MKYSIISKHRSVLMGIAALWIYVFHMMPPGAVSAYPGWKAGIWFFQAVGFCGVDMFLFLSGFGLYYHFLKHPIASVSDCLTFYRQRFSRIYQVFLPFAVIFALLANWTVRELVKRLFIYEQLTFYVFSFCWYVVCILVFYVFTPAFMKVYRSMGKWGPGFALGCCLVYILTIWQLKAYIRWDLYAFLNRVPVFILGFPAAQMSAQERKISPVGWIVGLVMLVSGVYLSFMLNTLQLPGIVPATNSLVNCLFAPGLILALAAMLELVEKKEPARIMMKGIAFYGAISFEFYLMQEWYVAMGKNILPVTSALRQGIAFVLMSLCAWLLQRLGRFLFSAGKRA